MQTIATPNLEQALLVEGFRHGPPAHLDPAVVAIDQRSYRRMVCPECGCRGQRVEALHKGREYRILCSCRRCGTQTEA